MTILATPAVVVPVLFVLDGLPFGGNGGVCRGQLHLEGARPSFLFLRHTRVWAVGRAVVDQLVKFGQLI